MIYDIFMFYDHLDILEIRMEELWNIVDKFVIMEATTAHTGEDKRMYYQENKDRFKKYHSKIVYFEITDLPTKGSAFYIERVNRDYFRTRMDFEDDDIFFLTDVDEIPKASSLRKYDLSGLLKQHGICRLVQSLHNYYVNYVAAGRKWKGPLITNGEMLRGINPSGLRGRLIKGSRRNFICADGGWHFSFLGGIDKIREKIRFYAHRELNNNEFLTDENILERIRTGRGLFDVDGYKFKIDNNMELPKYLMENRKKFSHLFLQDS